MKFYTRRTLTLTSCKHIKIKSDLKRQHMTKYSEYKTIDNG